jgi:hypothetical protein
VLRDVFSDEADAPPPLPAAAEPSGTGPPARYAALWADLSSGGSRTIADEEWTALCGRHGVGASGAMDALNEWGEDRFGEPVLEEDGGEIAVNVPPL